MQLDERVLSIDIFFVKDALSLCVCFASFNTSMSNVTLALSQSLSSYVQSDGDLFSSEIEQSSVLVDNAYR